MIKKRDVLFEYNDYELLYLASLNDEDAINLILKKYSMLVYKYISSFGISVSDYDDYLQEGRLVILKAISIFDIKSNKSFTKFVDLLIYRRFIDLIRKKNNVKYELSNETIEYYCYDKSELNTVEEPIKITYNELSEFEQLIYKYKYEDKYKPMKISKTLNISISKVYSAIERINKKIKNINRI